MYKTSINNGKYNSMQYGVGGIYASRICGGRENLFLARVIKLVMKTRNLII